MNATKDGGPAFPTKRIALDPRSIGYSVEEGMTLRDWFAGMALQGFATNSGTDTADKILAGWSYDLADAMIAARERKEDA